jgi:Bacterial EndoU nuclease
LVGDPWLTPITSERLDHSSLGKITSPDPKDLKQGKLPKLESGGHGQRNIDRLTELGFDYNIVYKFSNGVRTGNVPNHGNKQKSSGVGQSWFPETWTDADIEAAGKFVVNYHRGVDRYPSGTTLFANYKSVRVVVQIDRDKMERRIGSVFPDNSQQPLINPDLLEKNPYWTGK